MHPGGSPCALQVLLHQALLVQCHVAGTRSGTARDGYSQRKGRHARAHLRYPLARPEQPDGRLQGCVGRGEQVRHAPADGRVRILLRHHCVCCCRNEAVYVRAQVTAPRNTAPNQAELVLPLERCWPHAVPCLLSCGHASACARMSTLHIPKQWQAEAGSSMCAHLHDVALFQLC